MARAEQSAQSDGGPSQPPGSLNFGQPRGRHRLGFLAVEAPLDELIRYCPAVVGCGRAQDRHDVGCGEVGTGLPGQVADARPQLALRVPEKRHRALQLGPMAMAGRASEGVQDCDQQGTRRSGARNRDAGLDDRDPLSPQCVEYLVCGCEKAWVARMKVQFDRPPLVLEGYRVWRPRDGWMVRPRVLPAHRRQGVEHRLQTLRLNQQVEILRSARGTDAMVLRDGSLDQQRSRSDVPGKGIEHDGQQLGRLDVGQDGQRCRAASGAATAVSPDVRRVIPETVGTCGLVTSRFRVNCWVKWLNSPRSARTVSAGPAVLG